MMSFVSVPCRTPSKLVLFATIVVFFLHGVTAVNSLAGEKLSPGSLRRSLDSDDYDDIVTPAYPSAIEGNDHSHSRSKGSSKGKGGHSRSKGSSKGKGGHSHSKGGSKGKGDHSRSKGSSKGKGGHSHSKGSSTGKGGHSHSKGGSKGKGDHSRSKESSKGKGGHSHSKGSSKGKGGLIKLDQCYESCTGEADEPFSSQTGSYHDKPDCCKGGVSFLKMIYRGNPSGRLLLPSHEELSDFNGSVVNPCSSQARVSTHGSSSSHGGSSSGSVVKFVICDECFPDGADGVSGSCDAVSDFLVVENGTKVCLAGFDETGSLDLNTKFPTNLDFYFIEDGVTDVMLKSTLHTSCSTPIYSPWAAVLDKCEDDEESFYVDLSVVNIESLVDSPMLEFVDGVSAKDPTSILTKCSTYLAGEEEADTCCKGGASFLKVRVGNTSTPGILTADSTLLVPSDCSYDDSTNTVRFVSCSEDCLDPFSSQACTAASDSVEVFAGKEICFGVWDEEEKRIDFGSKMPTNLNLFYIENVNGLIQSAEVHTSCSKPLEAPYAQPFTEDCDPSVAGEPVSLEDISNESKAFYLAFVDGASRGYYKNANQLIKDHGQLFFNISFANCSCSCEANPLETVPPLESVPSTSPSISPTTDRGQNPPPPPTAPPLKTPNAAPSTSPTVSPTSGKGQNPPPPPTASPLKTPNTAPSASPTVSPTSGRGKNPPPPPTASPLKTPNAAPSPSPTVSPTSGKGQNPPPPPTASPLQSPTAAPSPSPTVGPTSGRGKNPPPPPTASPLQSPTAAPSPSPTLSPTSGRNKNPPLPPTASPLQSPTAAPSPSPTVSPTSGKGQNPPSPPTASPLETPNATPSASPTVLPTSGRGKNPPPPPTASPLKTPNAAPSASPTVSPTPGRNQNPPPDSCEERCAAYVLENCVVRTTSPDVTQDKACVVEQKSRFLQIDLLEAETDISGLSVEDQIKFHETMVSLLDSILNHE